MDGENTDKRKKTEHFLSTSSGPACAKHLIYVHTDVDGGVLRRCMGEDE